MKKKCNSKIGGQAVIEGVMMRGNGVTAVAVRDSSGKIQVESSRFKPFKERSVFYRIPVIRGVISFISSMALGMKTITRASEVYGDLGDSEPSKFERWLAQKLKIDIMSVVTFIGVVLGLALSVFLFVFLPNLATDGIFKLISLDGIESNIGKTIIKNLTSGAIRIIIFVSYIALTTLVKDINRLYRYHGAEHKTISAYENGLELTVENVRKMTTVHDRCGTTFVFVVMLFSIIFFSFFGWQVLWLRMLIRLAGIPIVAGISYEIIMLAAKYDNILAKIIKAPGLLLQKLTTKEPDDSMIEVAITAFNTVVEMEKDPTLPETSFITATTVEKARQALLTEFGDRKYESEIDLILMAVSGAKTKSELSKTRIMSDMLEKSKKIAEKRLTGMPLQYAIGSACFYGYDIKVDGRVLIPRFDTELLAEQAIIAAKNYDNPDILEICTGSGAVAIAVKLNSESKVTASDVSEDALSLAKENSKVNNAEINFVLSDLFDNIEGEFDIIIANPPYISEAEMESLDSVVKDYEPRLALYGGKDGLSFYRRIKDGYKKHLKEGGVLLLEIGKGQSEELIRLFGGGRTVKDYNDPPVDRILIING